MAAVPLLEEVDTLIARLEQGGDVRDACERILFLLDDDPTAESASLPSVSVGATGDEATWDGDEAAAGTWGTDALGSTVGTWAPDRGERRVPQGLRDICMGLIGYTLAPPDALSALRTWREVRRPAARYVLGGPLGRGGMGEVLEAHDVALDRELALKVLLRGSPAARRRFVGEAKLTARLDHPGVVPVHDVGETPDGRPYFAMKKVRGRSLRQVLDEGGLDGLRARLDVFRRVCETVAFAHDRGVLHLDLKPDNIMIGAFGEVLLMDWGLAVQMEAGEATVRHVAGTPRYMAPEQAVGDAQVDVRTDLYSLAVVLYELLCDTPAFPGSDRTTLLDDVRQGRFVPPRQHDPSVPRPLDALVRRCMARSPDDRLPDVLTLLAEVEAFLEDRPMATVDYAWSERLRVWARRNRSSVRGASLAAMVGAVVLVVATGVYVQRVTEARLEAEGQRAMAEESEVRALEEVARAQLTLGEARLQEHRYLRATEAYLEAERVLDGLGVSTAPAELGRLEAAWHQQPARRVPLPAGVRSMVAFGEAIYGEGGDGEAWRLPLAGDGVELLGFAGRPWVVEGELWFLEGHDGEVWVRSADGEVVRRLPYAHWSLSGDAVHDLDRTRWAVIPDGPEVVTDIELPCPRARSVLGPYYRCAGRSSFDGEFVHRRTGDRASFSAASAADGTGRLFWDPSQVQPLVIDESGEERWTQDEGGAHYITSVDGGRSVAWLVDDGRVRVRDWSSSALRAAFERPTGACGKVLAFVPERGTVAIGCADHVELLEPLQHPWRALEARSRNALAISPGGQLVAWAAMDGIRVASDAGGSRLVLPLAEPFNTRDLAFSRDGRLAVVTSDEGVWVVPPVGDPVPVAMEGRPLGGAWSVDGEVLAVVEKGGGFVEWQGAGAVRRWEMEGWEDAVWGVAPADDGWFLSDYGKGTPLGRVVNGRVVARPEGATEVQAFDVVSGHHEGRRVAVVGTADGAWLWDGVGQGKHLPGPLSVGVAWAPTGPVVAGNDNRLRFYTPEGELMHTWALPALAPTLAVGGKRLVAIASRLHDARVEVVSLPGSPDGGDPVAAAWQRDP